MTAPIQRPATAEGLFLWVMHRFGETFGHHAVIKGGIALRLNDCPRSTTDIDYVFVPYTSEKEIVDDVRDTLQQLEDASIEIELNSKMLRATIALDDARIQVEASVASSVESRAMATAPLATPLGQASQVVRVMAPTVALAHKLAAWNERRLLRDLYDAYFLSVRMGAEPDMAILEARLSKMQSRLPKLKRRRQMSLTDFANELRTAAESLSSDAIAQELAPLLPPAETAGLETRLRAAVIRLAELAE